MKEIIKKIYSDSSSISEILSYLDSVESKTINIEESMNYALPNSFTKYKYKMSEKYIENDRLGILFYFGDYLDIKNIMSNRYLLFKKDKQLENILKNKITLFQFDVQNKEIIAGFYDKFSVNHVISATKKPIVVQYKAFDFKTHKIFNSSVSFKRIYIYCDRTYPKAIEIINSIDNEKLSGQIIKYENLLVLVVKVSDSIMFFLPFLHIVLKKLWEDIENNKLRINIEKVIYSTGLDKTNEDFLVNDMNLIIRSIFQL